MMEVRAAYYHMGDGAPMKAAHHTIVGETRERVVLLLNQVKSGITAQRPASAWL